MASTITPYQEYDERQKSPVSATDVVDWDTDSIKCMIVTATYTPDYNVHTYITDVTNEVTGTGYTAGGTAVVNGSVTRIGNVTTIDFDDIAWVQDAAGFADGRTFVFYKDTGVPATSILIAAEVNDADFGNVGGPLTYQVNTSGLFTSTAIASV